MIFCNLTYVIGLIVRLTSDRRAPAGGDEGIPYALVSWRYADETRDAARRLGIRPVGADLNIRSFGDRPVGIVVESVPLIGNPETPVLDLNQKQLVYFPSESEEGSDKDSTLNVVIGEDPIDALINFDCKIIAVEMFASDPGGDFVVDILWCLNTDFDGGVTHPVAGDSITGPTPPTITGGVHYLDTVLTEWDTDLPDGSLLRFVKLSSDTIPYVTIALKLRRV